MYNLIMNCTLFCQISLQIYHLTFHHKQSLHKLYSEKLFRMEEQDQAVKEIELIDFLPDICNMCTS